MMKIARENPITERDIQNMATLRQLGLPLSEIGAHYGMTGANVAYYTRRTPKANIPVDRWLAIAPQLLELQEAV